MSMRSQQRQSNTLICDKCEESVAGEDAVRMRDWGYGEELDYCRDCFVSWMLGSPVDLATVIDERIAVAERQRTEH